MLIAVTHWLGCASFLFVILLMLLNRRPRGLGLFALIVFLITAVWAALEAAQISSLTGAAHTLDTIRNWIWLQFIAAILSLTASHVRPGMRLFYRYGLPILGLLAVFVDFRVASVVSSPTDYSATQIFTRIALATIGLLMVENLYRNTVTSRRWHITPFCIAAGLLFSYELFVFVDAVVIGGVSQPLLSGRGIVLVIIAPLLVFTMARNEDWRVDVHLSRNIVFHTATLTAGGAFLVLAALIASFAGNVSSEWGPALQIFIFCSALIVFITVLGMERFRKSAFGFIAENFFSHRYDYRTEWRQLLEILSDPYSPDTLEQRVIRAVGSIVESPGGALWLKNDAGNYALSSTVSFKVDGPAMVTQQSDFIAAFQGGKVVQQLQEVASDALAAPSYPDWLKNCDGAFIAVPLVNNQSVIGFIILAKPHRPVMLNWESFGLLRMVGRQVASYLWQERATRILAESQAIAEYNKRFAFVIHDVKNLASQLKMLVSNMRKFGDDPAFKKDMAVTLENSVSRLNSLLSRLSSGAMEAEKKETLSPVEVLDDVIASLPEGSVVSSYRSSKEDLHVHMAPSAFRSVMMHLLTNAMEASPDGVPVEVKLSRNGDSVDIEIKDHGRGMDQVFIQEKLFQPFKSTKTGGHGIGAFQSREIVREAEGELIVLSSNGEGTIMRITLPAIGPSKLSLAQKVLHT